MPFTQDSISNTTDQRPLYSWLETLAISIAAIVLGLAASSDDPFFLAEASFPWTILAPILVALRYGFLQAFVSSLLIIIANILLVYIFEQDSWQLPSSYSFGILIVSMLVGEFRDSWERRLKRLDMSNQYRQARLEEFTRNYHVLKLSHDQLEQENAGQIRTLRSALTDIQLSAASGMDKSSADAILGLFKHYAMAQVLGYYKLNENGDLFEDALAIVGNIGRLDKSDSLLLACLKEQCLVSVTVDDSEKPNLSRYTVVVPLIDAKKNMHAVIVISTLPFMALNNDNLKMMAILAGRCADKLTISDEYSNSDKNSPISGETHEFFCHLQRVIIDANQHDLQGALLVIKLDRDSNIADLAHKEKRGLDIVLDVDPKYCAANAHLYQLMLMPLSGPSGTVKFRMRFEKALYTIREKSAGKEHVHFYSIDIKRGCSAEAIQKLITNEAELSQSLADMCRDGH